MLTMTRPSPGPWRYSDYFVSAEESQLYAVVGCLKSPRESAEDAQKSIFLTPKFLVASSQKRGGLPACNKDVRPCCLMKPMAPWTRACTVLLYATTIWGTISFSAQCSNISLNWNPVAPPTYKWQIFLPVKVTDCLSSVRRDGQILIGKYTKYSVPWLMISEKYQSKFLP